MILLIKRVEDSGEGVIDDGGNVVFAVKYSALTFKPVENEVMDGVVKEIMNVNKFFNIKGLYSLKEWLQCLGGSHASFHFKNCKRSIFNCFLNIIFFFKNIPTEFVYSDSPEKHFSDKKNR